MRRMLVMTDSTCDLPAEWIQEHDIRVVPTYVQFDQESLADDGVHLTREVFYRRLATAPRLPTTAAPPSGQTLEMVAQALADAEHVIAVCASAALSGIFNTFRLAVEETDPQRVTLIDSQMVSMGLGWQVIEAAEMAERGASPADICLRLREMQPRTDVYAALDTLEYLRRSGRVGWARAALGSFLQVKPLIRLHLSIVTSLARMRTTQRAFDRLVELAREATPLSRLAILHTANRDRAEKLYHAVADVRPPGSLCPIVEVTPVIGVHVGPRGLGLGLVRKTGTTD